MRILLACALLTGAASAGDQSAVTQVVFTPDGTRVLAVRNTEHDGSGFTSAELTVLDTGTGRTLWSASRSPELRDLSLARRLLAQHWPALQKRFGFRAYTLSRPRYTLPLPQIIPLGPYGQDRLNIPLWTKPVPVTLHQWVTGLPCKTAPDSDWTSAAYRLQIGKQTVSTGQYECATSYTIARVDVQGNRVLVALNAFTPGFEGPNNDQLLVAATLK